jgi:hypothetical protein
MVAAQLLSVYLASVLEQRPCVLRHAARPQEARGLMQQLACLDGDIVEWADRICRGEHVR